MKLLGKLEKITQARVSLIPVRITLQGGTGILVIYMRGSLLDSHRASEILGQDISDPQRILVTKASNLLRKELA